MNINKIVTVILLTLLILLNVSYAFASDNSTQTDQIINNTNNYTNYNVTVNTVITVYGPQKQKSKWLKAFIDIFINIIPLI